MKQLYIFMIQYLFVLVGEQIDTAFINNVGIDAICVLSAFSPIMWTVDKVLYIGIEGYKVERKDRMNSLVLSILSGVFCTVLLISFSGVIPRIYSLTNEQYYLFQKALIMEGIGLVPHVCGNLLDNYLMLNCKNKLVFIGDTIFYVLMILTDAYVFINHMSLEYFMVATCICYIIYDVFLFIVSDFIVKERIQWCKIKTLFKHGSRVMYDGLIGKIATLFYNIYASKLGTQLYAIHAICYNICTQEELFSDALYTFTLTHLYKFDKAKRFKETGNILRRNYLKLIFIVYSVGLLFLVVIHGEVNYDTCLPYMLIYVSDMFTLLIYEAYKGYLICMKRTDIVKNCGLVGVFVRIPIVLIGYYSGWGIIAFAIPCTIDFGARAIYMYYYSRKVSEIV